jgi:large subunit ribosomal protein L22
MAKNARAIKRSIQSSPVKMRIVLNLIRGKRVPEALSILHFTPNHASIVAEKTLRSAVANFQMNPENARVDVDELFVRECSSDGGAVLKRILPAPMGRAFRVRKRSNHLTIVVGDEPLGGIKKTRKSSGGKSAVARATVKVPSAKAKQVSNVEEVPAVESSPAVEPATMESSTSE